MPISIKNPQTEQLARELAKETGESLTEVITKSLQDRMQRLHGRRKGKALKDEIADILARVDALPRLNDLSEDEILGYDENGIPSRGSSEPGSGH
ncbi:MAG: type II toxin-antitoxin system VapB family antitoxin [Candidatus Acidiferrum sp.]